jgi:hypothetical protein
MSRASPQLCDKAGVGLAHGMRHGSNVGHSRSGHLVVGVYRVVVDDNTPWRCWSGVDENVDAVEGDSAAMTASICYGEAPETFLIIFENHTRGGALLSSHLYL